jgi:serine/threonine protein kinase
MPQPQKKLSKWDIFRQLGKSLQARPARTWTEYRKLGNDENRGALNGGVFVVKDRRGKKYIEKRAKRKFVEDGTILQEITILQYLSKPSHEHITKMVDYFVDRKLCKASIYLERCDHGGLEALIESRAQSGELFNELDVWEWFIQLFDALAYCHYGPDPAARFKNKKPEDWQNTWDMVFHRDIKVENILVHQATPAGMTTAYTLKLADFGCAVARSHIYVDTTNNRKQASWATIGWQPPEAPQFVGRSDVWQLAAVVGCICNLMNMPFFDRGAPAPGYSTTLNNAIAESMNRDCWKRPKADAVLDHVRGKYKGKAQELERNPRPVPNHVDHARRKHQLERGHRKLKRQQQQAAAPLAFNRQGAGNAGWGGPGGM